MTAHTKTLTETLNISDLWKTGPTSTVDGTWSEFCKIGICAQSGSEVEFQSITETVDIDIGDKDFDVIATLGGGRVVKFTPEEPITITLEAYPSQAGTETGTTGQGFFDLMNTADTNQPLQISVDKVHNPYRIVLLWTDDANNQAPSKSILSGKNALRIVASDGKFTSVKPSFTDGILKFTIVYKVKPFDSSGNANFKVESTDTTAALPTLNAYTSSTKW